MIYLDTNIILRYLLEDHPELSPQAQEIFDSETQLFICDGVCAEIVYVLSKVYRVEREVIKITIVDLIHKSNVFVNDTQVIIKSLAIYTRNNIDYIDSFLCAYNHIHNIEIATFDQRLKRLLVL